MENSISMCLPLYGGTRQIVMKVILANQLKYGNSMIMNLVVQRISQKYACSSVTLNGVKKLISSPIPRVFH